MTARVRGAVTEHFSARKPGLTCRGRKVCVVPRKKSSGVCCRASPPPGKPRWRGVPEALTPVSAPIGPRHPSSGEARAGHLGSPAGSPGPLTFDPAGNAPGLRGEECPRRTRHSGAARCRAVGLMVYHRRVSWSGAPHRQSAVQAEWVGVSLQGGPVEADRPETFSGLCQNPLRNATSRPSPSSGARPACPAMP